MGKLVLATLAMVMVMAGALLGPACQKPGPTPTPPPYTVEQSERIAHDSVQQSPTYRFDGIEGTLELLHTETLLCLGCWEFIYRFQSRHAGYGDRTGQMLLQVITPHEARITVQEYNITQAIMDMRWDMLTQSFVPGSTVNVTQQAGLQETQRIEIYELVHEGPGYLLRTAISDPQIIEGVISGLDTEFKLKPRVRCPDQYHLHFIKPSGQRVVLGLSCGEEQAGFLRGSQDFWQFQDVAPPDALREAVLDALASSKPSEHVMSDPLVQPVVSHLISHYPQLQAAAEYDWRRIRSSGQLVGWSEYTYLSPTWVVQISWVVLPENNFDARVIIPSLDFTWTGRVSATGEVEDRAVGVAEP